MNDPHVVSLQYRLDVGDDVVRYINPPAVRLNTPAFDAELADGILTCTMNQHFASIEDARTVIDSYLRAWELETALRRGRSELHFVYGDKAEVIDRNPSPTPAGNVVYLSAHGGLTITGTATLSTKVNRITYPDPPTYFRITPNVETMWGRYQGYVEGRELLLSMAYFCLTMIEIEAGGRTVAANKYHVDLPVLSTLGKLTSIRGDQSTARKMTRQHTGAALAGKERNWIEAAVKALILRVGEYDPQNPMPLLTMQDLPAL